MKYLILISLLFGCNKKLSCGVLDSSISILSSELSKIGECDQAKVEDILKGALVKMKVCQQEVAISGINASPVLCNLAPYIADMVGQKIGEQASCKKTGPLTAELIKKVLKCDEAQ